MALFSVGSWVGRATQKVASGRAFRRVAPRLLPPLDRALHRASGGRLLLARGLLPGLVLTTTGRRSGEPRATPLMCVPEPAGTWLVVGSNFGQADHPAWTANLLAAPAASVSYEGVDTPVVATLLDGPERERAWAEALDVWPPFAAYQAAVDRRLRVFRLAPAPT